MSEKTEKPTGKRINELRSEGNICKSNELNAAAALLLSAYIFSGMGNKLISDIRLLITQTILTLPHGGSVTDWLIEILMEEGMNLALDIGIILLTFLATGVTITLIQTRFLWAKKRLGFKFNKLNPLNGFKNMFSMNGVVEFLKAFLKVLIVGWVAYSFLRTQVTSIIGLAQTNFLEGLTFWAELAITLTYRIGMAYIVLALADYAYQRWQYDKNTRMTKEEIKEELKQREGDPMIKNRIRGMQRRMARIRMMTNVKKADVIITNPTHLAIAIQYDQNTMKAPKVLAKGAFLMAERIIDIARASNIPIVQNIPLAHAIYKTVNIEQEIPPQLYMAMAEILARIYSLRHKKPVPAAAL